MALIADDAADRVEQMILLTERLGKLVAEETARIQAREPTAPAEVVEEKERLANAYRLELARIKDDPALVSGAPKRRLDHLLANTAKLQATLTDHEIALGAVKFVAEGLVQTMAEEINRQRTQMRPYGADGSHAGASAPEPVTINKTA